MKFPIATLTNGVKVMNFNSPHSFEFEDGTILNAVSNDIAKATQLDTQDIELPTIDGITMDVQKKFVMSQACLDHLIQAAQVAEVEDVRIILAPLPVISAVKDWQLNILISEFPILQQKLRTIYVVDRITKKISTKKFCV